MDDLTKVLIERDGLTELEALEEIRKGRIEFYQRLGDGDTCSEFCSEFFGLEEDYIFDLIG